MTHKTQKVGARPAICRWRDTTSDCAVAKHYLSDIKSFNETAKHWAQAYAQAPAGKVQAVPGGKQATDAEMAGLSEVHVTAFMDMGFPRDKVVRPGAQRYSAAVLLIGDRSLR